ncbi:hypothetical protein, partial [Mesorhizobium sp.]|uniref:hypothetical protein n=1 Tax=Mesorhizobium sp. TaxID=1871066 RepID=UPI0025C4AF39
MIVTDIFLTKSSIALEALRCSSICFSHQRDGRRPRISDRCYSTRQYFRRPSGHAAAAAGIAAGLP